MLYESLSSTKMDAGLTSVAHPPKRSLEKGHTFINITTGFQGIVRSLQERTSS
jgi:hypothetical protein